MSIPFDIGVCEDQKSNKKGVCYHCRGCRFCDPPPDCSLKRDHILYKIICRYQYSAQLLTNKDHSDVLDSKNKRRILNRKKNHVGKIELA